MDGKGKGVVGEIKERVEDKEGGGREWKGRQRIDRRNDRDAVKN